MTEVEAPALLELADRAYSENTWLWLTQQVLTVDEADGRVSPWPDKPMLKDLVAILDDPNENKIAIPKSRRMMATWTVAAWVTHRARYRPAVAAFWQSENEDKAAFVVSRRCAFIEDNLTDAAFRRKYRPIRTAKGEIGRMTWQETGSYVWGIPEGADAMRNYTPTILVMDESEFQQQAHDALAAAMPFVEKGAKLILISSSNGPRGVLATICKEVGFVRFQ